MYGSIYFMYVYKYVCMYVSIRIFMNKRIYVFKYLDTCM